MKAKKILIRFDDLCPTMDYEQWGRAVTLFKELNIKPLVGVIPECKDPDLLIDDYHENFWDDVKKMQAEGYTVAMHGLYHLYDNKNRGIVNKTFHSEFAGHSYNYQFEKIKKGKELLISKGIYTDIFFAPAHSYDWNTIKALSANGFKYLSDGFTYKAIVVDGVKCLPCLSGAKIPFTPTYKTYVFHAHEWKRAEADFDTFKQICYKYKDSIVGFSEYARMPVGNRLFQVVFQLVIVNYDRYVWPIMLKIYRIIRYR